MYLLISIPIFRLENWMGKGFLFNEKKTKLIVVVQKKPAVAHELAPLSLVMIQIGMT